ncbi:MAG TPA: hypothetical protein VMF59_15605 [Bacteroidota bacterium]|nr:hypothetical protein [Bacteroidota bacterium]
MNAITALVIMAGSVSFAAVIGALIGRPKAGAAWEREIVAKGILRSLKDLDNEIWQLQVTGIDLDGGQEQRIKHEVSRLEAMVAGLIQASREIKYVPEEDWDKFRDETLKLLDRARQYFRDAEAVTKAA